MTMVLPSQIVRSPGRFATRLRLAPLPDDYPRSAEPDLHIALVIHQSAYDII